jgi:hypothetical protein
MCADHPELVAGVNSHEAGIISVAYHNSDPHIIFDYLNSPDFTISAEEKYSLLFRTRFSKMRFTWDLWMTLVSLIDANSLQDFDNVEIKSNTSTYNSFFYLSIATLLTSKGSMSMNEILASSQSHRKSSSIIQLIACVIDNRFVNLSSSYNVVYEHCNSVTNPYISIGSIKLWIESQNYEILIRLFDKDQSGNSREISALNSIGVVSTYYSEKSYSYISRVKHNDAINEPNKERLIYNMVQNFETPFDGQILYLSADMSRFGPNTNQNKLMIANGVLTTDRLLLRSLNDTCLLMARKRFKMPQGILDTFTMTDDGTLDAYASARPKNIISQLWNKVNQVYPGWKSRISEGFMMEFGMTQGIMGTQSSVVVSSCYDQVMRLLNISQLILTGTSLSTSDDSLGIFEVRHGNLKRTAINLFSKITFLFTMSGHIINPAKSYMSQNIAELNSQWLSRRVPIVTPLKHAIAGLNPGGGLNPIEDALKVNFAAVDLLRRGSTVRLSCLLGMLLANFHLLQYNLLNANIKLGGVALIDVLPLPHVCPIETVVHPLAAIYFQFSRTFRDMDSDEMIRLMPEALILMYTGDPISILTSNNPMLALSGIPLRAEDQVFRARFKAHYSISRIAREIGARGALFPEKGQFKRESLSIADVIIGSWYDLTHESKMNSNDGFLSKFVDPMRSETSEHYSVGKGTFAFYLRQGNQITMREMFQVFKDKGDRQNVLDLWLKWKESRGAPNDMYQSDIQYIRTCLMQIRTFTRLDELWIHPLGDKLPKQIKQSMISDKDKVTKYEMDILKEGLKISLIPTKELELLGFYESNKHSPSLTSNTELIANQQLVESSAHLIVKFSKEVGGKFTNRFEAQHMSSYAAAHELLTNNFINGMKIKVFKPQHEIHARRSAIKNITDPKVNLSPPVYVAIREFEQAICRSGTRVPPPLSQNEHPYMVSDFNLKKDQHWRIRLEHLYSHSLALRSEDLANYITSTAKSLVWHGIMSNRSRSTFFSIQIGNDILFKGLFITHHITTSELNSYKHYVLVQQYEPKIAANIESYRSIIVNLRCESSRKAIMKNLQKFLEALSVAEKSRKHQIALYNPDTITIIPKGTTCRGDTAQLGNSTVLNLSTPFHFQAPIIRNDFDHYQTNIRIEDGVMTGAILSDQLRLNIWEHDDAFSVIRDFETNILTYKDDKPLISQVISICTSLDSDWSRHRLLLPTSVLQNVIDRSNMFNTKLIAHNSILGEGCIVMPDVISNRLTACWQILLKLIKYDRLLSLEPPPTSVPDSIPVFWKYKFNVGQLLSIENQTEMLFNLNEEEENQSEATLEEDEYDELEFGTQTSLFQPRLVTEWSAVGITSQASIAEMLESLDDEMLGFETD